MTSGNSQKLSYRHELDAYAILHLLSPPEPQYQLDSLLKRANVNSGELLPRGAFETMQWCISEDKRRARALRAMPLDEWWVDMALERDQRIEHLAEDLEAGDEYNWTGNPSRASAICTRELRLRFLGASLKLLTDDVDFRDAAWITLSHREWYISREDADWNDVHFDILRQFRALLRCSGVIGAPGFLIVCLHALFYGREFRVEFRGVCGGEKLQRFREIAAFVDDEANLPLLEDYIGGERPHEFVTTVRRVKRVLPQLAAMMPNAVTYGIEQREKSPKITIPPEPHYSGYITWLHVLRAVPIVVMSGVGIPYSVSDGGRSFNEPLGLHLADR